MIISHKHRASFVTLIINIIITQHTASEQKRAGKVRRAVKTLPWRQQSTMGTTEKIRKSLAFLGWAGWIVVVCTTGAGWTVVVNTGAGWTAAAVNTGAATDWPTKTTLLYNNIKHIIWQWCLITFHDNNAKLHPFFWPRNSTDSWEGIEIELEVTFSWDFFELMQGLLIMQTLLYYISYWTHSWSGGGSLV